MSLNNRRRNNKSANRIRVSGLSGNHVLGAAPSAASSGSWMRKIRTFRFDGGKSLSDAPTKDPYGTARWVGATVQRLGPDLAPPAARRAAQASGKMNRHQ